MSDYYCPRFYRKTVKSQRKFWMRPPIGKAPPIRPFPDPP
ncbi:hypothetical protein DT23_02085 [Thioclava indica]|uniref:Uncharacterized protein n=1 Tax=Thioclava indica TaxID=1353528 RepID=A0A074KJQ6_9RHOB|nr:hypothetical protein DT23_02085 [Thioclava indica]